MKMKLALSIVVLLYGFSSYAVRYVGNGGGDAELKILRMNESLSIWVKACNENLEACWTGQEIPPQVLKRITGLVLGFSQTENLPGSLILDNSNLYEEDEKTPKSDTELTKIFLQAIYADQGLILSDKVQVNLVPLAKQLIAGDVYGLPGMTTDFITSLTAKKSLQQELLAQLTCKNYRLAEVSGNSLIVRCEGSQNRYQVLVLSQGTEMRLQVRYYSEVD